MAIQLSEKFEPYVDEKFTAESKKSLLTNNDFDWTGAHTVKVYKVSTATMNNYDRAIPGMDRYSINPDSIHFFMLSYIISLHITRKS